MKILHLDQNHEYLSSELEKLGFENHYDYKSSKDEILEKPISDPNKVSPDSTTRSVNGVGSSFYGDK